MKKILLLGGSNCQKNALIHGKALGYEMIIADYSLAPIAATYADKHVLVSTFDEAGCIEAAKKYGIDGIMTMGTDQPVYTAAVVASTLGLPSLISPETAKSVTNKKSMKTIFSNNNIPSVKYKIISNLTSIEDLYDFNCPLVLKPLDSQGQRGVYKLDSKELVLQYLNKTLSFSREKEALLEEFYPSDEVTVSGWINNSKLYILTITDRILLDDPVHIGICTSHLFPSKHMDKYDEIRTISNNIVNSFELKNGPLYIQMLIGNNGIMVNEVASRIGGAFEDVIIPRISGFHILDAVMKTSLGLDADLTSLESYDCTKSKVQASVQLMFAKPGVISYITPVEELAAFHNVLDVGYNYRIGDEIRSIENATARFGHCVLATDFGNIKESIDDFKANFKILDYNGKNLYKVL